MPAIGAIVIVALLGVLVIGRPSPVETTPPPSAPASAHETESTSPTAPSALEAALVWSKVLSSNDGDILRRTDVVQGMVALGDGYVLAGAADSGQRTVVWQSADGLTWQRIEDAPLFDHSSVNHLVAIPGGALLIGTATEPDLTCRGEDGPDCNAFHPIRFWTSPNGVSWSLLPESAGAVFGRSYIWAVASGKAGLVAFAQRIPLHGEEQPQPTIWTSADGVTWDAQPPTGEDFADALVGEVAAHGDGYVAIGNDSFSNNRAWVSPDGKVWAAANVPPDARYPGRVWSASAGLLLGGPFADSDSTDLTYLTSATGADWTYADPAAFPFVPNDATTLVVADGERILALGTDPAGGDGAWLSADAKSWAHVREAGAIPDRAATGANLGVLGPKGAAVLVDYSGGSLQIMWTARWQEIPVAEPTASPPPSPPPSPTPSPTPRPTVSPADLATLASGAWVKSGNEPLDDQGVSYSHYLEFGRLDGRHFHFTPPGFVGATRPANDGTGIALWQDPSANETVVVRFDTATGEMTELMRTTTHILAAAISPLGDAWYYIPATGVGTGEPARAQGDGLWRQALPEGKPQKVGDWSIGGGFYLIPSADGSQVLIIDPEPSTDYGPVHRHVWDSGSGKVFDLPVTEDETVGLFGSDVLLWQHQDQEQLLDLVAIDWRKGSSSVLLSGTTSYAEVDITAEGDPTVVYSIPSLDGGLSLFRLGLGETAPGTPFYQFLSSPLEGERRSGFNGGLAWGQINMPGWVPWMASGSEYTYGQSPHEAEGVPSLVINLEDERVRTLPDLAPPVEVGLQ